MKKTISGILFGLFYAGSLFASEQFPILDSTEYEEVPWKISDKIQGVERHYDTDNNGSYDIEEFFLQCRYGLEKESFALIDRNDQGRMYFNKINGKFTESKAGYMIPYQGNFPIPLEMVPKCKLEA